MDLKVLLLCLVAGFVTAEERVRYDGYHVINIGPLRNREEVDILMGMRNEEERKFYFFDDTITTKHEVTAMVAPELLDELYATLDMMNLPYNVANTDYQKDFDVMWEENERNRAEFNSRPKVKGQVPDLPNFYPQYTEVQAFMARIAEVVPGAELFEIGRTYEGRSIDGLHIPAAVPNAPAVWIDGAHHAREWLTPTTVMEMMRQVAFGDEDSVYFYDWYFVPVVNPDGYTRSLNIESMWRKNREPNSGSNCVGTDLNRNYDDGRWRVCGTSSNPCSDTFGGPSAFSAAETQGVRDYITGRIGASNVILGVSIHSYSQLWLIPGACPMGYYTPHYDYHKNVAGPAITSAIQSVNGNFYTTGAVWELLYDASGGAFDWMYNIQGIVDAYTPELWPAGSNPGFHPSPINIQRIANEIWAGILAAVRVARENNKNFP